MGGSLALALQGKCAERLGIDRDPDVVEEALKIGAIEQGACNPAELLPQADLIVLGVPVLDIIDFIRELPALHPGNPVVLDLGSTKRQILRAMETLPERFDPIAAHPMCGKETSGFALASKDLYKTASFALVPLERTSSHARSLAQDLALAVGANPLWIDAATHDQWAAATSHFPYLLASALALATPMEARPLAGPGLRSTTRIAATSPDMMLDVLQTNSDELMQSLARFNQQLAAIESLVRQGKWEDLHILLERAVERQKYLSGADR
jgi:prephenate dehydrogenase